MKGLFKLIGQPINPQSIGGWVWLSRDKVWEVKTTPVPRATILKNLKTGFVMTFDYPSQAKMWVMNEVFGGSVGLHFVVGLIMENNNVE